MMLVLSILFLGLYALLIYYYFYHWLQAPSHESPPAKEPVYISVLIPARNEEQNIGPLLDALNKQTLNKNQFEVLVIDDFSEDSTADVVKQHPLRNLKLLEPTVDETLSSKKKAIECGIHHANGELIVTTDADCLPPPTWLETYSNFYSEHQPSFIAAPVRFSYSKNVLQIFQALDFIVLQGITAASVSSGFHTMCNGANLAYTKRAFIDVNGFEGIDGIATGDDMLLMHKVWKNDPSKVRYLKHTKATTVTQPMYTWRNFLMQRKRWASKTFVYDDFRIILVLAFVYLFNCFFFALLIAGFFYPVNWVYAAGFLIMKTLIEFPFVYSVAAFYRETKLMRYFLLFQPLHMFLTVLTGLLSQSGRYEWKGRRTK